MEEEDSITTTTNNKEDSPFLHRTRCCFNLPCFGGSSGSTSSFLDRFNSPESKTRWWARPFWAFREWSEIVAGPKWKTFLRRFNRNRNSNYRHQPGKFQYDPLSYALNFDEGQGLNGHFDDDEDDVEIAVVPLNSSSSS